MLKGTMGGLSVLSILLLTSFNCASSKQIKCPQHIKTFSAYPNEEAPTPDFYFKCENQTAVLRQCPAGFIYHFLTEKCIKSFTNVQNSRQKSNSDEGTTNDITHLSNQPTLGRIVNLGNLYYATTDHIANNENLWSQEDLEKMSLKQKSTKSSETETLITKDQLARNNMLKIEASLALSFMGGMVKVTGSAKYLDERRLQTNSVQVSLKFEATTSTESITADMKAHLSFTEICDKVGKKNGPTHVVTSLKRGFIGIFSFIKQTEDKTKNAQVAGYLQALIKGLPSIEIDASAEVETEETEKISKESLYVKFWGTTILDEAVTTFEDAVKVYKKLPEKAKKKQKCSELRPNTHQCLL